MPDLVILQGIFQGPLFSSVEFFFLLIIALAFLIGVLSGSGQMALLSAWVFVVILGFASQIDLWINLVILFNVLLVLATAFMLYEMLTEGTTEAA